MTPSEVKHLAAFHAKYDSSEKIVMCDWCHKQVPLSQAGLVPSDPTAIDPDTGMATDEVNVCYDCLPEPDAPVVHEVVEVDTWKPRQWPTWPDGTPIEPLDRPPEE